MYLAVWSNAVWELEPDGKPDARDDRRGLHACRRRAAAALGAALRASRQAENAITRTDAKQLEDRMEELRENEDRDRRASRASTADADRLLRLAAARAARARERADVHGLRRPRRDRRLEPRPRVARPRLHVAARPPHPHQRARRLRRLPGLGQRPAALPRAGPYRRRCSTSRSEYQPRTTAHPGGRRPRAERERSCSRSCSASTSPTPRSRRRSSSGTSRSTARAIACVVLDTRTRRVFRSRYLPPGLLSGEGARGADPRPGEQPLPAGIDMLVVVSQTPPVLPSIATRVHRPGRRRGSRSSSTTREFRRLTGPRARQRDLAGRRRRLRGAAQAARRVQEGRRALGRGALRRRPAS